MTTVDNTYIVVVLVEAQQGKTVKTNGTVAYIMDSGERNQLGVPEVPDPAERVVLELNIKEVMFQVSNRMAEAEVAAGMAEVEVLIIHI